MAEDAVARTENRPRLGRGLAALLGGANPQHAEVSRGTRQTPIEFLRPNPRNPRKRFDDAELDELAASIKERGIIQPIVVRAISGVADAYEIIAGERRWRAAQRAGLHEIPVIIVEAGDREALEIAIVENVQRADLNALEEAAGYAHLGADYGYSHSDIARVVSKSRSHVANTLRLTNLPEHTRSLLAGGQISAGHARALLAVADPDALANRIVAEGLTVRDIERLGENSGKTTRPRKGATPVDADTRALQEKLALAREHGADDGVQYPVGPLDKTAARALTDSFKAACGAEGAQVIYDGIGGDYSEAALRAIAWAGRHLVIGFTAGIPKLPMNLPLLKGCQIVGVFWGEWTTRFPALHAANVAALFSLYLDGKIKPAVTERFPLARGADAIARLGARQARGKIVVTVD